MMSVTSQYNSIKKIVALLFAVLLAMLALFFFFTAARSADNTTSADELQNPGNLIIPVLTGTLTVDPLTSTINVGEAITVDVVLSDVTDLYGIQLELSFDPAVVNVVGGSVTPGDCPQPDFVVTNSADNVAGTISYAAIQLNPTLPCDGGVVAKIAFQSLVEGQSDIHFVEWLLSDTDGQPLPADAYDGSISVIIPKATPNLFTTPDPLSGTVGDTLNDSATLSGGDSPTGDITFQLYDPSDATCAGVPAYQQVVTVSGNGVYSTSPGFEADASGTWRWTADYSGDGSNEPASSGCDEELVTIEELATPNLVTTPDPLSGTVGDTLNDSATLSGGDSPTGDITFRLYGPSDATCAGVPAYQQVVTVTGNGVYSTSPGFDADASGTWRWTADYSGDGSNESASSGCGEELVTIEEAAEGTVVYLPIVVR